MDLGGYNLEDLLLAAIKSEVDSNNFYKKTAKKTKNGLLKDKLLFLAEEEEKHRMYIEDIFLNHFPEKKLIVPKDSPVPLPEIKMDEEMPLSILLKNAMDAEKNANEFYKGLAERFENGSKIHNTLLYFADMEMGHYKMLEQEKESMERFEDADVYWPMVHAGP